MPQTPGRIPVFPGVGGTVVLAVCNEQPGRILGFAGVGGAVVLAVCDDVGNGSVTCADSRNIQILFRWMFLEGCVCIPKNNWREYP